MGAGIGGYNIMEYVEIEDMRISRLGLGCMRIADKSVEEVGKLIDKSLELGINFFDHADIYGGGRSEELFGQVLFKQPELRNRMIIQTKCAIVPGKRYDFSKDYILSAVDGSLRRLNTDYIDCLLLHRPDALADYEEIAEAFDELYESGKVRHFGVSNFGVYQIELMRKYVKYPLLFNQLQFSIVHCPHIDAELHVNMKDSYANDKTGGNVLSYCRLSDITVQAWSVIQASWEEGSFLHNPNYEELNKCLKMLAGKYNVTEAAIAVAWILRHPMGIMPILGTTSPNHLEELSGAVNIRLDRQEWYDLYLSAGKNLP